MLAHCLLLSARSMNGTMTAINCALEIYLGARACSPLAPVVFVLMIRMPAVIVVPAFNDAPPHSILADRLQADRTRLFLRGCAELLPHANVQRAVLEPANCNLHETLGM